MAEVAVIDYGVGNLLSVQRALEHCGATVCVTADPARIQRAGRVILPGVGAFSDGMAALGARHLDEVVRDVAASGQLLLGICLGMQMMMDESEEFGVTLGLSLIPGRVVPVPAFNTNGLPQKIPHIGWSGLQRPDTRLSWNGSLLADTAQGEAAYFVHSFMASPAFPSDLLAECHYGGQAIAAAIQRGNVSGCQFHPEKSGRVGLRMLRHFLQL